MQEIREARGRRKALRSHRRWTVPVLFACLGLAAGSSALTLGDLEVRSTLGQPFSGVVRVDAAAGEVIRRECFSLGADTSAVPGIPVVNSVRFVLDSGAGSSYLRLLGDSPVREPLAQVILQVRCPGLPRLTRTFVLLMDPATLAKPPAPMPSLTHTANGGAESAARYSGAIGGDIPPGGRYTVRAGDTLSEIAARINGRPPYSVWPLAERIKALNPDAFPSGRSDQLVAGASLRIPTLQGVSAGRPTRSPTSVPDVGAATRSKAVTPATSGATVLSGAPATERRPGTSRRAMDGLFDLPVVVGEPVSTNDVEYLVLTSALSRLSLDRIAQRGEKPVAAEPVSREPQTSAQPELLPSNERAVAAADQDESGGLLYWLLAAVLVLAGAAGAFFYAQRTRSAHVAQDEESPWELDDDVEVDELPVQTATDDPDGMVYDDFTGTFVRADSDFVVTESRAANTPAVDDPESDVVTHLMPTVDDSANSAGDDNEQTPPAADLSQMSPKIPGGPDDRDKDISVTTLDETSGDINEGGWVELDFEATQILEQDYLAEYAAKLKDRLREDEEKADAEESPTGEGDATDDGDSIELEIDEEPLLMAHEMLETPEEEDADTLVLAEDTNLVADEETPIVLVETDEDLTAELPSNLRKDAQDDNVVNIAGGKTRTKDAPDDATKPGERKKS